MNAEDRAGAGVHADARTDAVCGREEKHWRELWDGHGMVAKRRVYVDIGWGRGGCRC